MKRRGLFGLIGAGAAAPALAAVTPARPFTLDEKMAQAEIKVNEYIQNRFGELVETGRKGYSSEYGLPYIRFDKFWKTDDEEAPAKLAVALIEWLELEKRRPNQTLVWADPPSFSTYGNLRGEPDILKLWARGCVFAPGPESDMAREWSQGSYLWDARHPGKITLASSPRLT